MKIAVLTDSTAYLSKELREKHNIYMIPLSVVFGHDVFQEEVDLTTEQFYQKVRHSESLPTTSQPAIGEFEELFTNLAKDGYDAVISIHLSKKISGTYQAAVSAGKMIEGIEVYAFDSEISATPQGVYALEASAMVKQNKTPDEIIARLEKLKQTSRAYFMVDDLSHLQRGGRLSGAQALVGSLLKIKPILHFVDGEIEPFEKIRTRKKALERINNMLQDDIQEKGVTRVIFIHANDENSALQMEKQFNEQHPTIETMISYFGPVIGTHLGEGALGIAWYTEK
ncbi:MAG TPA: DegV family protein [Bacillota bacterium]|nr:DegV family protein [Bacillota bacterium]